MCRSTGRGDHRAAVRLAGRGRDGHPQAAGCGRMAAGPARGVPRHRVRRAATAAAGSGPACPVRGTGGRARFRGRGLAPTAARLLGLPLPPGAPSEVVLTRRPPARSNRVGPATRVHVADYADADVREVHGVPVLAGARLVLDCCSALSPPDALAVADAALRRNLVDRRRAAGRSCGGGAGGPGCGPRRSSSSGPIRSPRAGSSRCRGGGWPRPACPGRFCSSGSSTIGARPGPGRLLVPGAAASWARPTAKASTPSPRALYAEKMREDWLRDRHRVEVVRWVTAEMVGSAGPGRRGGPLPAGDRPARPAAAGPRSGSCRRSAGRRPGRTRLPARAPAA